MVEHVYRRARAAGSVERVLVATDDTRIADAVGSFGGECVMTSPQHASGTDRVAEAVADMDVDLVVNVQGDEPFLAPEAIEQAIEACRAAQARAISTLRAAVTTSRELWDPNVVKVVTDLRGFALYFSRRPIPYVASSAPPSEPVEESPEEGLAELPAQGIWYKHIGLYVYPKALLLRLTALEPSPLERRERLEQLRALENGIAIRVADTEHASDSVDTPEDLARARERFFTQTSTSAAETDRFRTT